MKQRSSITVGTALWAVGGLLLGLTASPACACLWDADTLAQEQRHSPQLAEVILGKTPPAVDTRKLGERITRLRAERREDDPAWWNDLAGAHIRLGEPQQAVELLEPAAKRFPNDYGVHANLGTAYHLLGRYREAAREIARDLEINPNAHFGLERYHLALLQYLVRDRGFQSRHVYVDEWSHPFLQVTVPRLGAPAEKPAQDDPWHGVMRYRYASSKEPPTPAEMLQQARSDLKKAQVAQGKDREQEIRYAEERVAWQETQARMLADAPPPYRYRWDLASDAKFEEGVVYLASLNPQQPACFTMLGIAALKRHDLNLAVHAFERATELGSPQATLLEEWARELRHHIRQSRLHDPVTASGITEPPTAAAVGLLLAAAVGIRRIVRRRRVRAARSQPPASHT